MVVVGLWDYEVVWHAPTMLRRFHVLRTIRHASAERVVGEHTATNEEFAGVVSMATAAAGTVGVVTELRWPN